MDDSVLHNEVGPLPANGRRADPTTASNKTRRLRSGAGAVTSSRRRAIGRVCGCRDVIVVGCDWPGLRVPWRHRSVVRLAGFAGVVTSSRRRAIGRVCGCRDVIAVGCDWPAPGKGVGGARDNGGRAQVAPDRTDPISGPFLSLMNGIIIDTATPTAAAINTHWHTHTHTLARCRKYGSHRRRYRPLVTEFCCCCCCCCCCLLSSSSSSSLLFCDFRFRCRDGCRGDRLYCRRVWHFPWNGITEFFFT